MGELSQEGSRKNVPKTMAQSSVGHVEASYTDSDKSCRQGCIALKFSGNSRCPLIPFHLLKGRDQKGADHKLGLGQTSGLQKQWLSVIGLGWEGAGHAGRDPVLPQRHVPVKGFQVCAAAVNLGDGATQLGLGPKQRKHRGLCGLHM